MEENNNRHVELPSTEGINDLTPQDQLIYLGIRSFMNKDTMEAFPSQEVIGERIQENTEDIGILQRQNEELRREVEKLKQAVFKENRIPEIII